jgi:hypothetical protein
MQAQKTNSKKIPKYYQNGIVHVIKAKPLDLELFWNYFGNVTSGLIIFGIIFEITIQIGNIFGIIWNFEGQGSVVDLCSVGRS